MLRLPQSLSVVPIPRARLKVKSSVKQKIIVINGAMNLLPMGNMKVKLQNEQKGKARTNLIYFGF